MPRKPRSVPSRTVNPNYFVFCEGETEVTYVTFLSRRVRKNVQVIALKQPSNINKRALLQIKEKYVQTPFDKTYVMFDLDVKGMLDRLKSIPEAILLVSNPCFELWLLLHFRDSGAEMTTRQCIKHLEKHLSKYKKGYLSEAQKGAILAGENSAKSRALRLNSPANPSTTVYRLLDDILS